MNIDQAKFSHQYILITNVFVHLMNRRKKKVHIFYTIGKAVSEVVREWLTGRSSIYS